MGGNSMSALHEPITTGDVEGVKKVLDKFGIAVPLLLHKQFVSSTDSCSCLEIDPVFTTPLKYCIIRNEPECLRVLLQAGGDPNEGGVGGSTLLHKACKRVSIECVKVLLEFGARVYDCDEWGVYPIHCCVGAYGDFKDSLAILDILLDTGHQDDIHLKDAEYRKLPLHYAAFYGNTKMCARLLELGADINAIDRNARTAYQSCDRQKKTQEFLKNQGCELPEPPAKKNFLPPLFPPRTNAVNTDAAEAPTNDETIVVSADVHAAPISVDS